MTRNNNRQPRPHDYDEPYNRLPRPRGASTFPTSLRDGIRGWWVGGEWIEAPAADPLRQQQHRHMSPIIIEDDEDSDCKEIPPPVPQRAKTTGATQGAHFDFNNSEQAVPWAARQDNRMNYKARSLADSADDELLSYLAGRSISQGFLREIDQFLRGHPEIADYPEGRETIVHLNSVSPLEAYRYFLRGYTRPARYIDGIVKSEQFTLPVNCPYQPISSKRDPELVDFFEGFEYRWDIIKRIDEVVRGCIHELCNGRPVPSGYRRLVCYALWGNPSDAYKWYEYQLQEDYLPHRYLPEHVVLGHLPKLAGEANPHPSSLNTSRRHMNVRYRMARANDEGIDVLEVLLAEFKAAVIRKGFRRVDIVSMCTRAKDRLENERRNPTGVDIVDLIMDETPAERPVRRIYARHTQYTRPASNRFRYAGPPQSSRKKKKNKPGMQKVPAALRAQAVELRSAKTLLERAYKEERSMRELLARCTGVTSNIVQVAAARARIERRYVHCLIRYCRNANQMSPVQARELQANFTCRKMAGSGIHNETYLLGMFPQELK